MAENADRRITPLETLVAEAIARSRHYSNLAAVDAVDDGEPDEIRAVARLVVAALDGDRESGARLRDQLTTFCDSAEKFQGGSHAWVPTSALRHFIDEAGSADG